MRLGSFGLEPGRAIGRLEGESVSAQGHRFIHLALREALLVALLAAAAGLFINHGLLYLTGDTTPRSTRPEAYVLSTLVLYLFVRGVDLVLRLRPPRVQGDLVLCPECRQELPDGTPQGIEAHFRRPLTPPPTEREILAAIALRKAVDEARYNAQRRGTGLDPLAALLKGDVANPASAVQVVRGTRAPEEPKGPSRAERPKTGS